MQPGSLVQLAPVVPPVLAPVLPPVEPVPVPDPVVDPVEPAPVELEPELAVPVDEVPATEPLDPEVLTLLEVPLLAPVRPVELAELAVVVLLAPVVAVAAEVVPTVLALVVLPLAPLELVVPGVLPPQAVLKRIDDTEARIRSCRRRMDTRSPCRRR